MQKIIAIPNDINIKDYSFVEINNKEQLAWKEIHWIIINENTNIDVIYEVFSRLRGFKNYK